MGGMGGLAKELERLQRQNAEHAAMLQAAVGRVAERVAQDRSSTDHMRELLVRLEPYVDVSRLPADLLEELRRALAGTSTDGAGSPAGGAPASEPSERDPDR